jgi:hypothetical protein
MLVNIDSFLKAITLYPGGVQFQDPKLQRPILRKA